MGDSNRIQWGKVLLGMGTAMMAVVCLLAATHDVARALPTSRHRHR